MFTKYVICRTSGLSFTLTDNLEFTKLMECAEHPTISDRKGFHELIWHRSVSLPKEYIAAGILLLLQDQELAYRAENYPKFSMGKLNTLLCKLPALELLELHHRLDGYRVAYDRSEVMLNLETWVNDKNPWYFVTAIRTVLGDDPQVYEAEERYKLRRATLKTRKLIRTTITKNTCSSEFKKKIGSMNLKAVWARVPREANKWAKGNSRMASIIESSVGISLKDANILLPVYQNTAEPVRLAMALLYQEIGKQLESPSTTVKRSFTKVVELLKRVDIKPLELTDNSIEELNLEDLL